MSISRVYVHKSRHPTRRPVVCAILDDHGIEHGKSVQRIDQGSSAGYRRTRKEPCTNQETSGARTPPDAGTGTRAFNAPAAFSLNPPVTGSVIGNRHLSCHSFCSFPHQTSQNVAGRREWVATSNQDCPRDAQGQRSG